MRTSCYFKETVLTVYIARLIFLNLKIKLIRKKQKINNIEPTARLCISQTFLDVIGPLTSQGI